VLLKLLTAYHSGGVAELDDRHDDRWWALGGSPPCVLVVCSGTGQPDSNKPDTRSMRK
jgi:hypothetical protein